MMKAGRAIAHPAVLAKQIFTGGNPYSEVIPSLARPKLALGGSRTVPAATSEHLAQVAFFPGHQ
jgi:hypothetical protein